MLNLIQIEFLKLRRRKFVWLMLLATLFMPFLTLLYFRRVSGPDADPVQFYKMAAFSYSLWLILPVVLGMLCTMLMYDENQYHMMGQFWIVPVSKMGYIFSKFFVALFYSICFMLITVAASVIFGALSGCITFQWGSVIWLFRKCMEAGIITPFVMLPILAVAASQKGYILPVCATLVYTFLGFILMMVNMYLHPLSSMEVLLMRNGDIPGVVLNQAINVPLAFSCICVWDIAAILLADIALRKRA